MSISIFFLALTLLIAWATGIPAAWVLAFLFLLLFICRLVKYSING